MIKINTELTSIPIELGDLKFEFHIDDISRKKMKDNVLKLQSKFSNLDESLSDDAQEKEFKKFIKELFDTMLGKGAFAKIYEQTPSVAILLGYFLQIAEGIELEIAKRQNEDKLNKYLNK